jgi:hypothetical protein
MIPCNHIAVLKKIYGRMKGKEVVWVVTGSLGLALRGIPVQVHDIDIQTDKRGAYAFEKIFSEYVSRTVTFSSSSGMRSFFGELTIEGLKVEIMGDVQHLLEDGRWNDPPDIIRYKQTVDVEGMAIPVLALECELRAYRRLGRADKVKAIEKRLRCR